jgi:hypothetical protein
MELKRLVRASKSFHMRFVVWSLCTVLLLTVQFHEGQGYSHGAPDSKPICTSMIPGHGVEPQTSPLPYLIKLDKTSVNGGENVQVTLSSLESSGRPIKGFLVLARKEDYKKETTPQGEFISEVKSSSSAPSLARITDCSEVTGSSMTHMDSSPKKQVVLNWQAPNVDGKYRIL